MLSVTGSVRELGYVHIKYTSSNAALFFYLYICCKTNAMIRDKLPSKTEIGKPMDKIPPDNHPPRETRAHGWQ